MSIQVQNRWRLPVGIATIVLPLLGVVASFLTLPPLIAGLISLVLVALGWLINRMVFRVSTLLVMALPTDAMEQFWFGTAWGADRNTYGDPTLSLVYLNKTAAADAYRMLKTWSFGKRVDADGHIKITIVDEGESRYSIFVMPGSRSPLLEEIVRHTKETSGPRTVVDMHVMHAYIKNCVDYSQRPEMQKVIDALPFQEWLSLEAAYIENDQLVPYAKQPFKLSDFSVNLRADLVDNDVASHEPWADLRGQAPAYIHAVAERLESAGDA